MSRARNVEANVVSGCDHEPPAGRWKYAASPFDVRATRWASFVAGSITTSSVEITGSFAGGGSALAHAIGFIVERSAVPTAPRNVQFGASPDVNCTCMSISFWCAPLPNATWMYAASLYPAQSPYRGPFQPPP